MNVWNNGSRCLKSLVNNPMQAFTDQILYAHVYVCCVHDLSHFPIVLQTLRCDRNKRCKTKFNRIQCDIQHTQFVLFAAFSPFKTIHYMQHFNAKWGSNVNGKLHTQCMTINSSWWVEARTHLISIIFYCLKFTLFVVFCFFTQYKMRQLYLISRSPRFLFPLLYFLLRMATMKKERETLYIWIHLKMITTCCMISFYFCWFLSTSAILKCTRMQCIQWKESHTWNCNTINANVNFKNDQAMYLCARLFFSAPLQNVFRNIIIVP